MPAVLVTHADQPLGRRVVKRLYHDPAVEHLLALGAGPAPRSFDRFLAESPPRLRYARLDLARHRPVSDLFHSERVRESGIDTLVHVPRHGVGGEEAAPVAAGLPLRVAEARIVLSHALATASIRTLIAIGSAFVYRLAPGNANRVTEDSELELDPSLPGEFRTWVDCDMLFHAEVGHPRLRVVLLRVPTVVAAGGAVYLNPALEGALRPCLRPLGFDPLCALVSDQDLARGVQAAVHRPVRGVFNLAGRESLPLSTLVRWTGRTSLPLPGPLLHALGLALRGRGDAALDGPQLRYGMLLDTARAARELGFAPGYRVGLARAGDGRLRLETSPA